MKKYYLYTVILFTHLVFSRENKLFWDGRDWNKVLKKMDYNEEAAFNVKKAYLNGVLDRRFYDYLKTWQKDSELADALYSETVDYLTNRELIRNIDYFYKDPLNSYIPIPSAIIIANMYAERLPIEKIEIYINDTRQWINKMTLNLDTLNYSKLLEKKLLQHNQKQFNQYE